MENIKFSDEVCVNKSNHIDGYAWYLIRRAIYKYLKSLKVALWWFLQPDHSAKKYSHAGIIKIINLVNHIVLVSDPKLS